MVGSAKTHPTKAAVKLEITRRGARPWTWAPNVVAGTETKSILEAVDRMISIRGGWPNPYVDGHAAERIVGILLREYDSYSVDS